ANVIGIVALAGVVVTMRIAAENTLFLYRSGFFWFSVASAVVIAVIVRFPSTPLSRFLGLGPLVAIGLRSYSIYLWHWPVRVFVTGEKVHLHGTALFLVRLTILVVLSEASYRLVERPFRTGRIARRTGSRGAIAAFVGLIALTFVLVQTAARPRPLPPTSLAAVSVTAPTTDGTESAPQRKFDIYGDSTGLVFGLSAAGHLGELQGISGVGGQAMLGCGLVETDQYAAGRIIERPQVCDGIDDRWRITIAAEPDAVRVIHTGAWEVLDHRVDGKTVRYGTAEWTELVRSSYERAFDLLTNDGRTVFVFQTPCYGDGDPAYPLPERAQPQRVDAINVIIDELAAANSRVVVVPWRDVVCPGGTRAEALDGADLWEADGVHLTDDGAVAVWKWFLGWLDARE
ncbi:MAG TPA: acyltransferase family protein, partial [Acidimicrobiia bacterium]|nr:acyltransferase family protein [Acidimicrobiia bacterium]